jgi:signal transduction histidine kinase
MSSNAPSTWHRWTTLAALLLAWAVLAAWQWQEYNAESAAARETLRRQAESITNALVGGVRSHRRLGRFLDEQVQGALDEVSKSQDVLAVAVIAPDRRMRLTAGKPDLLDFSVPIESGATWTRQGFCYAVAFGVPPEMPGLPPGPGGSPMPGGFPGQHPPDQPAGPNPNGNEPRDPFEPGRGVGRGPVWQREGPERRPPSEPAQIAPGGGRYQIVLLLDREAVDRQIAHYAWLRVLVVFGGGVVILSVVLAWRATVHLAEARGAAQLLETEARHLRDLGQAASGLAHETRNPLGLIRGWTQRWMQSIDDGPQRLQAQAVIEECDRVTARINQFLAFARPCRPKLAPTRVGEVVAELAALVEPDLEPKALKLVWRGDDAWGPIQADREMLRQALFNLIRNAVQFSPNGAEVEISQRAAEDGARRIEVADRGPGVPAEAVERLFTPYNTTRGDGAGLGLAIVRRIAVAHGWQSGYNPRPGGGAIFWMEIHG